ncbi:MAG: NUDIX domain-containing protein [Oscillospiraceae bacterium]|nr:NUDIX domain-containing protein [Oscillospiraceae bacterium]
MNFERICGVSIELKPNRNSLLGRTADITIDRHLGSRNIRHKNATYSVHIGHLSAENVKAEKKHMVYILGAENTSDTFEGMILATILRRETNSLLLVAAPTGKYFYEPQIRECLGFYEKLHDSDYEFYMEKSCGVVLFKIEDGVKRYLIIENRFSNHIGFPKGHIEFGETDKETAIRETLEETGILADISEKFSTEYVYNTHTGVKKRAVYFTAEYTGQIPKLSEKEIVRSWSLTYEEAIKKLNYPQDMIVLMEAHDYYEQKRKSSQNMR